MKEFWEYMGLNRKPTAIIHHDDLGMFKAQNDAFRDLPFPTGSILSPSTWVPDLVVNPKPSADLGVHLTLNSEWTHCRIRPLTCGRSLKDPQGYLWRTTEDAWRNVKAVEVEDELRAQVEHVLKLGIDVTHIDTHMGSVMRPDLAEIYVRLACYYKVPALIPDVTQYPQIQSEFRKQLEAILDKTKLPRFKLAGIPYIQWRLEDRKRAFRDFLLEAEPGVYHVIHHACFRTDETGNLPDIDIREGDFTILKDPEIRELIEKRWELVTYREVRNTLRKYLGNEPWII
ncbi:MAG: ChbG/HpnK family deacetylase [Thermofilaceae archaeon]